MTRIARSVSGILYISLIFLLFPAPGKAQVSPFQGLGQAQFFGNDGAPLTNGVLYSYQAGTSTQQATYTDSTGTTQNVNPITFGSGARAQIWLMTSAAYKFVLCAQNDGPSCAGGDILFSVDNVPGGATSSGGGGGSPFIGIFISGTASPATSGAVRLASGDSICYRNAAGSANLCFSKTSTDILQWAGGSLQLQEVATPSSCGALNFDCLWADSTAHRLKGMNNGGTAAQYVFSGNDISTTDAVTALHFGATQETLSATAPTTGQCLQFNGTIGGAACSVVQTAYLTSNYTNNSGTFTNIPGLSFPVLASKNYTISCNLDYSTTGSTTTIFFGWTGPGSPTTVTWDAFSAVINTGNQTSGVSTAFTAIGLAPPTTGGVNQPVRITMTLINGVNAGTLQLQAAQGGSAGTVTVIPGSCVMNN